MPKQLMQNCEYLADPIGHGERILRVGSKLNHPFRFQSGSDSLRGLICFNSTSSSQTEVLVKTKLCCEFLSRRRDPSAIICYNSAPELEILMDKKIKEQSNTIPYLPEELIINILMRLPADVLHSSARPVCKRWASIVRDPLFIEAHLQQSKTVLFIEGTGSPKKAHLLEIKGGGFQVTDLRHRFPGRMMASCDGVALFNDPNDNRVFHVANPATLKVLKLPYLDAPSNPLYYSNCIGRVHSTGEYKVVHAYEDLNKEYHWLVLTVGIDNSWRKISCQHPFSREYVDLDNFPVSVGGVIYWTDCDFQVDGFSFFLAMDVDNETIHEVPIPDVSQEPCAYMKMGDYLSGFTTAPLSLQFEIWVLKDWRQGQWAKLYQVNMEISIDVPQDLFFYLPLGWLNNNEVLILEALTSEGDMYMAYDVKKNEIKIVDLSLCAYDFYAHVHTSTLASWTIQH
ncbi:putative F-box protein [Camellia lanceoleosa]|uniref:F-box protein n=1 Tax=Camellia lanceoleosa TaxID=1840588 RepID=A0ACC0H0P3_9ERIC|nr:putative F-box protein [Camellia lanceoleosa]